jgi:hypothetical protein
MACFIGESAQSSSSLAGHAGDGAARHFSNLGPGARRRRRVAAAKAAAGVPRTMMTAQTAATLGLPAKATLDAEAPAARAEEIDP